MTTACQANQIHVGGSWAGYKVEDTSHKSQDGRLTPRIVCASYPRRCQRRMPDQGFPERIGNPLNRRPIPSLCVSNGTFDQRPTCRAGDGMDGDSRRGIVTHCASAYVPAGPYPIIVRRSGTGRWLGGPALPSGCVNGSSARGRRSRPRFLTCLCGGFPLGRCH
jgi:hypothetical protein